jgi:hypothetical protein
MPLKQKYEMSNLQLYKKGKDHRLPTNQHRQEKAPSVREGAHVYDV